MFVQFQGVGMKPRASLIIGAVVVAVAAVAPARAASLQIEVRNTEYRPRGLPALAGDVLTWKVTSGTHTVTAYAGADFDSGPLVTNQTFTRTFGGGTVKYRCEMPGHSSLDAEGKCTGMCGTLSDTPPTVPKPAITDPVEGALFTIGGAWVRGTAASPAKTVRIAEGSNFRAIVDVVGGAFERFIEFGDGPHTITATAIDVNGFESAASTPVSFTINIPDAARPAVSMYGPSQPVELGPLNVAGVATDDKLVAYVDVEIQNPLGTTVAQPAVNCARCGLDRSVQFNVDVPLFPGLYVVVATATDGTGKTGSQSKTVIVV